jgi:tetratricopeptide (TPR) repeat protein
MAEKDAPKTAVPKTAAEPPKPVHIGGESLVDRLLPHVKKIIVGTIVLAVILTVVFAIRWFSDRKQIQATEELDRALEIARQPIVAKDDKPDPKDPKDPKAAKDAKDPKDAKKPGFASDKDRATAVLAAPGLEVAGPAYRGGLLFDVGKFDEAIAAYKTGVANKTIEGVLCREGLGLALEAKASADKDPAARQKGFEEALAAFAAMQPDEAGVRRAYALYHQGRMQLLLGKRAEAKALFESAKQANKDPGSEIAEAIEKRLATLGAS